MGSSARIAAAVVALSSLIAAGCTSAGGPRPVPSTVLSASAIPGFYVALSHPPDMATPNQAIAGNAVTGQVLTRVSPPAGTTFAGIAGAGDDRTYVLDAQAFPQPLRPALNGRPLAYAPAEQAVTLPRTWYLLRLRPAAPGHATLTRLPVPATPAGSAVTGIALSPDGSKLAVSAQADPLRPGYRQSLRVYSVATGALLRTWTTSRTEINSFDYGVDGNSAVTWLADGVHVVYLLFTAGPYLRMVDIRRPGGDLVKDAIKVVGHQLGCSSPALAEFGPGVSGMVRLTPDGSALACGIGSEFNVYDHLGSPRPARYCSYTSATESFTIVSAATQQPIASLASYAEKGHCTTGKFLYPEIAWISPGDRDLIGYLPYPGPGWAIYSPGHVTPLHVAAGIDPHYTAW